MGDDSQKTHVALIPARGGSKEVKNKNLKEIMGRTLVHHALYSAVGAECFSQIILSTDIRQLAASADGWHVRMRPAHLCQDDTPMGPVIFDAISHYSLPDHCYLWLLQPTSPFRITSDYASIRRLIASEEANSCISMHQVEDSHPTRQYTISNAGRAQPIVGKADAFGNRQALKPCYQRNGMFYVVNIGVFKDRHTLNAHPITPYIMDPKRAHNINTAWDMEMAALAARLLRDKGIWPA